VTRRISTVALDSPTRSCFVPSVSAPDLKSLQHEPGWHWAVCPRCNHRRPLAIAPFVIRWGPDAPGDLLRRSLICERCGHRGALLYHPSWVDMVKGWEAWPGPE
jgi:hypothetical protein